MTHISTEGHDDPAMVEQLLQLDVVVQRYRAAREAGDYVVTLLEIAALTAQCAAIYNLNPPAGILHPSTLFRTS